MAKILLVEDDPMLREEYATFLRSKDGGSHEVDVAGSATKAVGRVRNKKYDLVLLDVMMAYDDEDKANPEIVDHEVDYGRKMGVYVYTIIQGLEDPPLIALVSVVDDFSILAEFPVVVGYLKKYFRLEALGKKVARWLKGED